LARIENTGYAYYQAGGFIAQALGVLGQGHEVITPRIDSSSHWHEIQAQYNYAIWVINKDASSALADLKHNHSYSYYSAAALADMHAVHMIDTLCDSLCTLDTFFLRKATVAAIEHLKNNPQAVCKDFLVWHLAVEHPNEAAQGHEPEILLENFALDLNQYPQASESTLSLKATSTEADQKAMIQSLFPYIYERMFETVRAFPLEVMDLSLRNDLDHTPLHAAIDVLELEQYMSETDFVDNKNIIKLLLEHTADVNTLDDYNNTPLYSAIDVFNTEIIHWLLDKDANPVIDQTDLLEFSITKLDELEINDTQKEAYQACLDRIKTCYLKYKPEDGEMYTQQLLAEIKTGIETDQYTGNPYVQHFCDAATRYPHTALDMLELFLLGECASYSYIISNTLQKVMLDYWKNHREAFIRLVKLYTVLVEKNCHDDQKHDELVKHIHRYAKAIKDGGDLLDYVQQYLPKQ